MVDHISKLRGQILSKLSIIIKVRKRQTSNNKSLNSHQNCIYYLQQGQDLWNNTYLSGQNNYCIETVAEYHCTVNLQRSLRASFDSGTLRNKFIHLGLEQDGGRVVTENLLSKFIVKWRDDLNAYCVGWFYVTQDRELQEDLVEPFAQQWDTVGFIKYSLFVLYP